MNKANDYTCPIGYVFLGTNPAQYSKATANEEPMDDLLYDTSFGLIFDYETVITLHRKYRLLGDLIGVHPKHLNQTVTLSLPLQLHTYSLRLAIEEQILLPVVGESKTIDLNAFRQTFSLPGYYYTPITSSLPVASVLASGVVTTKTKQSEEDFQTRAEESYPKTEFEELSTNTNSEGIVEEYSVGNIESETKVQIRNTHFHKEISSNPHSDTSLKIIKPDCLIWSKTIENKYIIFKDLWKRGFYMTGGLKFGVDWLVYDDDPVLLHAKYMLYIVSWEELLTPQRMNAMIRLAVTVRKTVLMASVDDESRVKYVEYRYYSMKKQLRSIKNSLNRIVEAHPQESPPKTSQSHCRITKQIHIYENVDPQTSWSSKLGSQNRKRKYGNINTSNA